MTIDLINPALIGGGLAVFMFLGILLFLALGRRLGRLAIGRGADPTTVGSLETAVFALLGLLIAFTFAGALSRFDGRRAQAVEEANAIGTAYLRVDLVPAAAQPKLREAFRKYVDSRLATYRKLPDIVAARAELERSRVLQGEIWEQAVAATAITGVRPGTDLLLLPALNQMFDITVVRIVATRMHPPLVIYAMLIGLAFAAALLAGYQSAGEKVQSRVRQIGFAVIVTFTFYVILDIEYPRLGFVRIDAIDEVLMDVRAGMK
ncbi:MAG TPA: DUF4239 domain-containing protein [Burkholderiales bacterium]|nr:DUF4239 domain-containing protein [Burkholderiales bacterium]